MRILHTSGTILAIRMGFFSSKGGGDHTELSEVDVHCVFLHVTCCLQKNVYKTVYNLQINVCMKNKLY